MSINYNEVPVEQLKGLSIRTPFNQRFHRKGRFHNRVDVAEVLATRRLLFGGSQSTVDLRHDLPALERARLALGV